MRGYILTEKATAVFLATSSDNLPSDPTVGMVAAHFDNAGFDIFSSDKPMEAFRVTNVVLSANVGDSGRVYAYPIDNKPSQQLVCSARTLEQGEDTHCGYITSPPSCGE